MKFKLTEYFEIPPVDYKTGTVNGDDIFDDYTHSPFYDDLLRDPEYMKKKYNLKGEIIKMSPNEYFSDCAKYIFPNSSVESLLKSRGRDTQDNEYLKDLITKYKKRLFLPYINYADKEQEGLHRMYVAGELFGWDHKFPVLVINYFDEERRKKEEKQKEIKNTLELIADKIEVALSDEYDSLEQFEKRLNYLFNDFVLEKGDLHYRIYLKKLPEAVYEFDISDVPLVKDRYADLDDDIDDFFIADLSYN